MSEAEALQQRANARRREFVRFRNGESPARIDIIPSPQLGIPPEVSVLIPSRDGHREGALPRLLEQVRTQSFRNLEVILVIGDSRQGRAINAAAAVAQAPILLTLDDDAAVPDTSVFERLVSALRSSPEIAMAGACNTIPEGAPALARAVMRQVPRRSARPVAEITDSDLAEHGCLAIRAEAFFRAGGEHEWLPRGLDPYLRSELRKLGYRIVVAPQATYHHLPPATWGGLTRLFFRNGCQAAFTQKCFPEFMIETPSGHVSGFRERVPLPSRMMRAAGRLLGAILRGRLVYASTQLVYAAGYLHGWLTTDRGARRAFDSSMAANPPAETSGHG